MELDQITLKIFNFLIFSESLKIVFNFYLSHNVFNYITIYQNFDVGKFRRLTGDQTYVKQKLSHAPHVEIKQGLLAIHPDFRELENENPYMHMRAFEEVIDSFYAQNVIETTKLRFFPFSLKDKAKGWLYTLKLRSMRNWGEMTQEFYKKFVLPHKVQ